MTAAAKVHARVGVGRSAMGRRAWVIRVVPKQRQQQLQRPDRQQQQQPVIHLVAVMAAPRFIELKYAECVVRARLRIARSQPVQPQEELGKAWAVILQ